jgi:hypothetical protein
MVHAVESASGKAGKVAAAVVATKATAVELVAAESAVVMAEAI